MSKILVCGRNGQVGWELQRSLATLGEVIALDRHDMDLSNPDSIRRAMRLHKPTLVVNAAAYTAVDKAEEEFDTAMAINGVAPGIIAEEAKRLGAVMIHYSTDYVFDGQKQTPYVEEDTPNPLNAYGKTKLAGEQAIQSVGVHHIIFRTSWVYSMRGTNFLLTMLRLAQERDTLHIVDDQIGAPTWARVIAEATAQCLEVSRRSASGAGYCPDSHGIFHLTTSGTTSWYGFAEKIFALTKAKPRLTAIATAQYPTPAQRPLNSCLSNDKLEKKFGVQLPRWETAVARCLEA